MRTLEEIKSHWRINVLEEAPDGMKGTISFAQWTGSFIFSFDAGWEHLSIRPFNKRFTPSWDEMSTAKDIFWSEDEAAIQVHPPKSEYVNNLSNCLHLWRCTYREMILPPACLVGIKDGQTKGELLDEIGAAYKLAETYKDPLEALEEIFDDYEDTDSLKVQYLRQLINYYKGGKG